MTVSESGPLTAKVAQPNLILFICCGSLLVVGMDVTIVNVALAAIQKDLGASLAGLQWVVDAYTLVVASFLMFSGSVSDRLGRKRVFQTGLLLFSAGSLLCSVANGIVALVLFRALQGFGASMLNPVALSIIANAFPAPKDRARAVGIWSAVGGLALALGPVLGGILIAAVGWRSIFWINLPICFAAVALTARYVPESKATRARAFDPLGQTLILMALGSLTFGVIEGGRLGWNSPRIIGVLALASCSVIGFLVVEWRSSQPLIDLRFFRSVSFSSATVLGVIAFASFAGLLFLNALYLQQVRGFSALDAGLCTLPLAITMMIAAPYSGKLVGSVGTTRSLLSAGVAFLLSFSILHFLQTNTALSLLLVAYALFGLGLGMVNPAISDRAVAGMPLSQAGVAAAVASTSRQVGAALGVAIAGTVVHTQAGHGRDFALATHPFWSIGSGCAIIILIIGLLSGTAWGRESGHGVLNS